MKRMLVPAVLVPAVLVPLAATAGAAVDQVVEYEFRIDLTWTAQTHPTAFPPNGHVSPPVGASHDASVHFWRDGEIASDAVEDVAERGRTVKMRDLIADAMASGQALDLIFQNGINPSPGSRSQLFRASDAAPLVTVITMLAPSPDWIVGVDSLPLRDGAHWVEEVVIDLRAWDAGTDSGTTFTAINEDTDPREPIRSIAGEPPFAGTGPLGTMRFTFVRAISCGADLASPFGVVDLFDLLAYFDAFGAQDASADLNTDGSFDVFDVLAYVDAFTQPC